MGRRIVTHRGADGRRYFNRIRDTRFSRTAGAVDPRSEVGKALQYSLLHVGPGDWRLAWKGRLEHPAWSAVPNAGHRALVELERRGKLHALVTQNIDGLHQRAGNSPDCLIEVHGRYTRSCACAVGGMDR